MPFLRNVRLLWGYTFFSWFLVIIPVIVPYYLEIGLTMSEVFQIQAVFALGVAVFEIPTGYLSDVWSRKKNLLVGALLLGVSFSLLPFCKSFGSLVAFQILASLAHSFVSGTDVALLYDSIGDTTKNRGLGKNALANLQLAAVSSEAIASMLSGVLILLSFGHVLWAQAAAAWLPFFFACFIIEPPIKRMTNDSHLGNLKRVVHHVFVADRTLRLIFLNLTIFGLSTFFAVWVLQKYWQDAGVPLAWFGAIWAFLHIMVGLVGKFTHQLEERWGPGLLLVVIGIFPVIAYFIMGWGPSTAGVVAALLFYISRGFCQVLLKDAFNWRIPTEFRATAGSFSSLAFRLSFAASAPLVGYTIDRYGLSATLNGLGLAVLVCFVAFMLPLIRSIPRN